MSIFYLGGKPRKVDPEDLTNEMFEDRYFMPGHIHFGDDYLIRIYLNDAHCESESDADQFEVEYITSSLVRKAHDIDPLHGDAFYDYILENCESFGCPNDGKSDFAELFDVWSWGEPLENEVLYLWATGEIPQPVYRI